MSPLLQFELNARCLVRVSASGQWHKMPHFLRGIIRALREPRPARGFGSQPCPRDKPPIDNRTAALRAG